MSISCLPLDVITLIFLTLPCKTLLKLKCVNKFCARLIGSNDFVRAQLQKSTQDPNFLSNCSVIGIFEGVSIEKIPIDPFVNQTFDDVIEYWGVHFGDMLADMRKWRPILLNPVSLCRGDDRVVGSFNGLICTVTKGNECRLWNPCIGKSKLLGYLEVDLDAENQSITYGFGYDACNDDYKVVASCLFNDNEDYYSIVKVYSLKRDSWKRISDFKGGVLDGDSSKLANGKIHWLSTEPNNNYDVVSCERKIISFDVKNEVFEEVEQPNYGNGPFDMVLSVIDGCICVLCSDQTPVEDLRVMKENNGQKTHIDLWVMKENGSKKSWSKLFTISTLHLRRVYHYLYLRPCFMLPNGEIVFNCRTCFLVYNPRDNSCRSGHISTPLNDGECILDNSENTLQVLSIIYFESLVSPVVAINELHAT